MRTVVFLGAVMFSTWPIVDLYAGAPAASSKKVHRKTGIEKREPWTTSKIHGTPDPPSPYRTQVAFPKLKFFEPLAMTMVPGTNRFVIAERPGKIFTFENDPKTDKKDLLLDVGTTVYSVAFHPQFQRNGFFFVTTETKRDDNPLSLVEVTRYRAKQNSLLGDANSKTPIISWEAEGHKGGCLRFGLDGFLYISVGDGSGIADQRQTGQDLSDLLGSILRIDVDGKDNNRNYAIPKDNPFVKTADARPEIWSYGHRQIWQFCFDRPTGNVWAGEVGQDLWEMVYLIKKAGNYGWSIREGSHPFRPLRKKGPTPFVEPIVEHSHSDFRSITGGYVYRGKRLPKLRESYIYADYDTGKIWSLRWNGRKVTDHRELDDTQLRVVAFGQDREGEVFLVDFTGGLIHQLAPAPPQTDSIPFPQKLSQTGLFASTKNNRPARGLIPYSVNAPLWSDHGVKERFIALPGESKIEFETVTYPQPAPGSYPGWGFPHDTVLVKTFSLEMESGNPESLRRLETRILHHKHMPGTDEYGTQFWRGYTYVWNDEQTDADLLEAKGLDRTYTITDASAPSGKRKQTWRFPSRAECTLCHTMSAKYALGVTTLQMNKDHDYGGVVANQLRTLDHLGVFTKPLPKPPADLPRLVDYRNGKLDLNLRARSYLDANCAHCHRKWGGGNAEFQLLATLPMTATGTIGERPGQGHFDLTEPRLLVPGHPERSLIHYRMQKLGLGRMPHIASNVVDEQSVRLVAEWIRQMPKNRDERKAGTATGG